MVERQIEWIKCELDVTGLVTAITEAAWCSETKSKDQALLYTSTGEVKKEWADIFWSLHSAYEAMVESYIREDKQ